MYQYYALSLVALQIIFGYNQSLIHAYVNHNSRFADRDIYPLPF